MFKPVLIALGVVLSTSLATAASETTPMSAEYEPACGLSASDLDFGLYNPRVGASGTATVQVTCNTEYSVAYSGFSGQLRQGSSQVAYSLSVQQSGVTGPAPTLAANCLRDCFLVPPTHTLTGDGTVLYDRYLLSGMVPPAQSVPAGTYSESITFTLTYTPE